MGATRLAAETPRDREGSTSWSTPIRVGAVSYLNAKPLYYRLCDIAPEVRLTMDVPAGWRSSSPPASSTSR